MCLLALVASWLLLFGPLLDQAAATRAQAEQVRDQNEALRASVDALRADFAHLAEYESELTALDAAVPSRATLTDLTRELAAAATAAGVTIVGMDVSTAVALTGEPVAPPAAAEGAASDTAATTDPAAPAAPAAPPAGAAPVAPPVPGMVAIPLSIDVVGSVEPARAFLAAVQTALDRQLLVTTLAVKALEESDPTDRMPATAVGDVEVTVGALAYVLPRSDSEPTEDGVPLPGGSGANPFVPSVEAPAPVPPDPAQSVADAVAAAIAEASATAEAAAAERAAAAAAAAAATQAASSTPPAATTTSTTPGVEVDADAAPADPPSGG
ncbi:hypothetical protein CAE01nite_11320 [Cellulomonas aerilata]|uniref:Tfp pilus assembly protein PilO n=1 Tax=Cellulomonas aerilata TaxID=515326 RepID=A0A512DAJ4_9CELL|nr:hypothetical protein CAE01nite_11320 [Cellulomonas aerilata]